MSLRLVIGNKNLSSWSLRPWLLLKQFGVPFEEERLPLDTPEFYARIAAYSPSGRVPVLRHGELSAAPNQSLSAGIPASSYTPEEARSLIDTRPMRSSSMFTPHRG